MSNRRRRYTWCIYLRSELKKVDGEDGEDDDDGVARFEIRQSAALARARSRYLRLRPSDSSVCRWQHRRRPRRP